jgi:hypothetical protein
MIIAIDFLDTIATIHRPDNILTLLPNAKNIINLLYEKKFYIIIWTTSVDDNLIKTEKFLIDNGILFHKINENKPNLKFPVSNKIYADVYIDSKSIFCKQIKWLEIPELLIKFKENHDNKKTNR